MASVDLAVVGAGPAGLTAALTAAEAGARVVVLDEQADSGGQIYRQPPATYRTQGRPPGKDLVEAVARHPHIEHRRQTTVWGVLDDLVLALSSPQGQERLTASRVLLAPGAYDRPVAFTGWTLPGVMTAGGVQAFVKSQRLLPGRRFLLVGAHPLQLVIAEQLLAAGAEIEAVVFAQRPRAGDLLAEIGGVWGHWSKLGEATRAWQALRRAGVPVRFGQVIVRAEGTEGVEAAVLAEVDGDWRLVPGSEYRISVDTVALGYGFLASSELSRQAGAAHDWRPEQGGWVCRADAQMESSVPGLFVAGEITGVAGAEVAAEEGRLAGTAIATQLGCLPPHEGARRITAIQQRLADLRRFAAALNRLFAPRDGLFDLIADETVVCRCESLTAGSLRQDLREHGHVTSVNSLKLLTRCGMGLCQGRFCGLNAAHLVAEATGNSIDAVGCFTARPPVKPIPIAQLVGPE